MAQPKTDHTGRIQKPPAPTNGGEPPPNTEGKSLMHMLLDDKMQVEIQRALPEHLKASRMIRIAMTALRQTRNLHLCSAHTFFGALIQSSQLGLEVNTPLQHCWLIPRRNNKLEQRLRAQGKNPPPIYECTLMLGYQGMIELSMRTDRVAHITAMAVRDGDYFKRRHGLRAVLDHEPSDAPDRESKELTYAWALAELKNGGKPWVALSRPQIEARRARSATPNEGPWVTDYEAMACKSAIRALWKVLPKSSEMALVESLEVAADTGKSQASAYDSEVRAAIERNGLLPLTEGDDDLDLEQFRQATQAPDGQEELAPATQAAET
jgi:recombination protein RecT